MSMYQDDVEDDSKPALVHGKYYDDCIVVWCLNNNNNNTIISEETETRLKEMDKKVFISQNNLNVVVIYVFVNVLIGNNALF